MAGMNERKRGFAVDTRERYRSTDNIPISLHCPHEPSSAFTPFIPHLLRIRLQT